MQETLYRSVNICRMMAAFKPTFRLFIACEDQAAFSQAMKVENQIKALFGNEIQISRLLWNFALLRHEQLREYAVMEAAEAEMILISLRAAGELPPHVKSWIESLPVRREAGQSALVALIGSEEKAHLEWQPHVDYLRRIAENRGLDFFCNRNSWAHRDFLNQPFEASKARCCLRNITFRIPSCGAQRSSMNG